MLSLAPAGLRTAIELRRSDRIRVSPRFHPL
jgi:hypothetical protein